MYIVGLTGGIGSGKSTVAKMFRALGVPIYISDEEAKKLMDSSEEIKQQLVKLLGEKALTPKNIPNRPFIAQKVFSDKNLLERLNKIVHPVVEKHFSIWVEKQKTAYVIYESAILFENNAQNKCNYIILVTAPAETRIKRVMERDGVTKAQVEERMKNQWDDKQKQKLADFIIENINLKQTQLQVEKLHGNFLAL
ncbi:dephospho-CoA kinase [Mesonia hippocampi]|uniref:Dephospho-CoA kinase n=1 Tax=Mesonia hippocampi TaxID=1628250 RepID=A0A840ERM0_9FLAO|nr:dephospho-CoA kinase [Mesonia hippocampi]MBB4119705.1 dephospho-CoA kinase [Mesonia hippocampi]